jgi:hypothetical protein
MLTQTQKDISPKERVECQQESQALILAAKKQSCPLKLFMRIEVFLLTQKLAWGQPIFF